MFCEGERPEGPGTQCQGGSQLWQTFCCASASVVMPCACGMLGMAQKKQNYVIWKVPVMLKAMRGLPGSFCKAIQERYFRIAINQG